MLKDIIILVLALFTVYFGLRGNCAEQKIVYVPQPNTEVETVKTHLVETVSKAETLIEKIETAQKELEEPEQPVAEPEKSEEPEQTVAEPEESEEPEQPIAEPEKSEEAEQPVAEPEKHEVSAKQEITHTEDGHITIDTENHIRTITVPSIYDEEKNTYYPGIPTKYLDEIYTNFISVNFEQSKTIYRTKVSDESIQKFDVNSLYNRNRGICYGSSDTVVTPGSARLEITSDAQYDAKNGIYYPGIPYGCFEIIQNYLVELKCETSKVVYIVDVPIDLAQTVYADVFNRF